MRNENSDTQFSELYREFMRRELARPEIGRAKQEFIARNFAPAPAFTFHPFAMVPAVCLTALFLVFFQVQQMPEAPRAGRIKPIALQSTEHVRTITAKENEKTMQAVKKTGEQIMKVLRPRVEVKRVSSNMGPTMVYQKTYQNTPVTIVWVFTGGKA